MCKCGLGLALGDRGKKKLPLMLLSFQPVLGRGTSKSLQQPEDLQELAQRVNLKLGGVDFAALGATYGFLLCALLAT